jgi:hypothetical protein
MTNMKLEMKLESAIYGHVHKYKISMTRVGVSLPVIQTQPQQQSLNHLWVNVYSTLLGSGRMVPDEKAMLAVVVVAADAMACEILV